MTIGDTNAVSFNTPGYQTQYFMSGSKTHSSDGRVFAVVDTQEGSKLQQQLCAHWGITMDPCYKADLGFRWFRFPRIVGDFQSPNGSKLYTLAQTGNGKEETRSKKKKTEIMKYRADLDTKDEQLWCDDGGLNPELL